jgi:hypothetical protein
VFVRDALLRSLDGEAGMTDDEAEEAMLEPQL